MRAPRWPLVLLAWSSSCYASVFEVDYDPCHACSSTFTEGHMFGSGEGPLKPLAPLLPAWANGPSSIMARLNVTQRSGPPPTGAAGLRVAVAFYAMDGTIPSLRNMPSICMPKLDDVRKAMAHFGVTAFERSFATVTPAMLHARGGRAHAPTSYPVAPNKYTVVATGRQYMRVELCNAPKGADMHVGGSVAFRNPYGFMPAVDFGLFPFQVSLLVGFGVLLVYFSAHLSRNRSNALPIHTAIRAVLLISLVESALWCVGFLRMNAEGTPHCCPYPPWLVAAVLVQMLRKTLCRVLLLLVALGVGMVYESLRRATSLCVGLLAAAYFGVGVAAKIAEMTMTNEEAAAAAGTTSQSLCAKLEWGANVCFILWIFAALDAIRNDLAISNQTHKLAMYTKLSTILGVFCLLFAALTFFFVAISKGWVELPWQWYWAFLGMGVSDDGAFWHLLDFSVLATFCCVWRPSPTSSQYSWSVQLPSSAEDADAVEKGIEMAVQEGEYLSQELTGQEQDDMDDVNDGFDVDADIDLDLDLDLDATLDDTFAADDGDVDADSGAAVDLEEAAAAAAEQLADGGEAGDSDDEMDAGAVELAMQKDI